MRYGNLVVNSWHGWQKRAAARRLRRLGRLTNVIEALESRVLLTVSAGDIFVVNQGTGTIGEYDTTGAAINASLISGLPSPQSIAVSGNDLFVASLGSGGAGVVGEYTTAGTTVNASLITTGLNYPYGIAVSGSDLFVLNDGNNSLAEYTTSGTLLNADLITGLNGPFTVVASGADLFITNFNTGTVGEYTTAGATVNANFISGLNSPEALWLSGSDFFVANISGTVGEYTTTGATVNAAFVTGLNNPHGLVVSGSDVFVNSTDPDTQAGTIGEYTTAGGTVNAALITTGLTSPYGMWFIPTVLPATQLAFNQQPGNTTVGNSINPAVTVDVEDVNNDIVSTDTSSVTLTVASGPGTLGGNVTVAAVNGVATFSNLTLSQIGNYTLQATDGSLTAATSSSFAVNGNAATLQPVYRLYSPVTNEHIYTDDANENATLGTRGWTQEGIAWYEYNGVATVNGVTDEPLYRLYDTVTRMHLWTTSANEYNTLIAFTGTWSAEGISGYVFPTAVNGSIALYRMSYPFAPNPHFLTTDLNEYNTLAAQYGWTEEGTIGYVLATAPV